MKKVLWVILVLVIFLLSACGGKSTEYPLAEPGPYHVGVIKMVKYIDESRGGKEILLTLWYPTRAAEAEGIDPLLEAPPDASAAPHPLILTSTKLGTYFAPHLASYGFIVAGVNGQDSKPTWGEWLIDFPLDLLFALDQLASSPPASLEGLIDADHSGTMGYSFDSFTALALGGARIDPEYYLDLCANPEKMKPAPEEWWIEYICTPANDWQAFTDHAGEALTTSTDGLWQAMTDERIKAVMPMVPEGAWMFGERGLAAVDRPVLVIGGTADTINPYKLEACPIYKNLGYEDKIMISFIDQDHMMVWDLVALPRLQHFAVAFFGYHLQGSEAYAELFSKDFIRQHAGLDWGIH